MSRFDRPRGGFDPAGLWIAWGRGLCVALALCGWVAVSGCRSNDAADSVHAMSIERGAERTSAPGRPSLLEAPRVRRLAKRGWVEVEAAILASDEESPVAARRRAIRRARAAAVEYVAGVSVRTSVVTLDHVSEGRHSDLLQALTATQANALVVDEELLDSQISLPSGAETGTGRGYEVRVKLAARVLEHHAGDSGFETEVRLNGSQFRPGDRVELAVRVSEAARVYVLSVSDAGAVVLLPNRHRRDTRLEAETWTTFPGDELGRRGVSMQAALPEGRLASQEALIVVALRGRRRLENLFPASGELFRSAEGGAAMTLASDFLSPLLSIPASEWTFDQLVYSISAD